MSEDKTPEKPTDEKVNEELKKILEGATSEATDEKKEERADMPREETFDQVSPSVDPTIFDNPANTSLKDVVVTDQEKEEFLECILFDKPFGLDIEVLRDKKIHIRTRSTYEQALCYKCLFEMQKEPEHQTGFDILLWLQRLSMALSVTKVFGKPVDILSFEGDSDLIQAEHITALREFVKANYINLPYTKWQVLLRAFMEFTAKEKILLDNVVNRDFWNPVG